MADHTNYSTLSSRMFSSPQDRYEREWDDKYEEVSDRLSRTLGLLDHLRDYGEDDFLDALDERDFDKAKLLLEKMMQEQTNREMGL